MNAQYLYPDAIADGAWLEAHLNDSDLRIIECTTYLDPPRANTGAAYSIRNARPEFEASHIPNACLIDLQKDFSDASVTSNLRFMMPKPDVLGAAFAEVGVCDGSKVVLYSRDSLMWSTRVWWMLRAIGFDNAAVLDGGYEKWCLEGRPTSRSVGRPARATLTIKARPEVFVDKEVVKAAIGDPKVCTVNALSREHHQGDSGRYGRPGRIPGSVNVPYSTLLDASTHMFLDAQSVASSLREVGADAHKRCLVYCGGGIAASLDAFLMYQLGYEDVAVYDASMSEWAMDPSLPMETG